jgi:hypothetical protein
MSFGKEIGPEILSFIETNWNWNTGYKTKTSLLSGVVLNRHYDK